MFRRALQRFSCAARRKQQCTYRKPEHMRGFRSSRCLQVGDRGRWLNPRWDANPWHYNNWGHRREFPLGLARTWQNVMKFAEDMHKEFDSTSPYRDRDCCGFRRGPTSMETAAPEVKFDGKEFQIKVDVQHYAPEDVKVKIVDNRVMISGQHESKTDDYGTVSRQFSREFSIPEAVEQETLECSVSDEGFLTVTGKVKQGRNERELKIEREPAKEETKE